MKEGYGQLASAFGMSAMLLRKGTGGMNRSKDGGGNVQGEGEERKVERNFGEPLSKKANKTGKVLGYARERGLSGLASDGLSKASEKATKPFKDMRNVARGGLDGFKDGLTDGTAIEKNSRAKASTAQDNGRDDISIPT